MQFDIEKIRERPGMYVGSDGPSGVYNLIFALVEEFINADNEKINISITQNDDDSLLFICNRLIDVGNNRTLTWVKALSDIFEVSYANDSVKILFRADKTIFEYEEVDYYNFFNRFKELAQLNENVRFLLSDSDNKNLLQYHNGLNSILLENLDKTIVFHLDYHPLSIYFVEDDIEVDLSMIIGIETKVTISYANNLKTQEGGTHVQGLYDGIYVHYKKCFGEDTKQILINKLNFVISIRMKDPMYGGAIKSKLSDKRAYVAVQSGVMKNLGKILETDQIFQTSYYR